jgi:hypothetical protein
MERGGSRHCLIDGSGFWAKSSFNREILPIDEGEELTRQSTAAVKIPVVASFTDMGLDVEPWLEGCGRLERAGAAAIQLDLFYIENLLSTPDFENKFVRLITEILLHSGIPVMPKLNIGLPAGYAVHLLKRAGVRSVCLLDSIKVPPPIYLIAGKPVMASNLDGGGLSLFGSFMLPLTRQYTRTLADEGFEVCAGGGVNDAEDAVDLIMLGASSIQIATRVLLHGYGEFSRLNRGVENLLGNANINSIDEIRTIVPNLSEPLEGLQAGRAPRYDALKCSRCGICVDQAFCDKISLTEKGVTWTDCECCGLCGCLCQNGAIRSD